MYYYNYKIHNYYELYYDNKVYYKVHYKFVIYNF